MKLTVKRMEIPACDRGTLSIIIIYFKFSGATHFRHAHFGNGILTLRAHCHTSILTMHILMLPFSQSAFSVQNLLHKIIVKDAFSGCHSENVHYHTAILRMRIFTLHFQDAHSHTAILIYIYQNNVFTQLQYFAMSSRLTNFCIRERLSKHKKFQWSARKP